MLNFIKGKFEQWKFSRTPLMQALRLHTQTYFYDQTVMSSFSQANKEKLIGDFMAKLAAISVAPDPRLALRESLAEYVLTFAKLQVVCLKEFEKAQAFYADNPYISGELHHCISEAAEHVEELARYRWESEGVTDDDLVSFANARCALLLYYMNGLNIARIDSGDETEKDWYKPFVEAMLVWEEDNMREDLGMTRLLPGDLDRLCYSVYMNLVVDGVINPFFEWVHRFPEMYLAGEGENQSVATS